MITQYLYRVWLIVPSSRQYGLNQFIKDEFDNSDWLLVPLSPSGSGQATHWACSFACTHEQTSTWSTRLATDGGIQLPPEFASMGPDQRIAFMEGASPALQQITGVIVRVCRNDQMPWVLEFSDILDAASLKRIEDDQLAS